MLKKGLLRMMMLFMPSAEQIAEMVAKKMAEVINDSGKNEAIQKWSTIAQYINYETRFLTDSLANDGKIDEEEQKQMSNRIKPLIEKLLALI